MAWEEKKRDKRVWLVKINEWEELKNELKIKKWNRCSNYQANEWCEDKVREVERTGEWKMYWKEKCWKWCS